MHDHSLTRSPPPLLSKMAASTNDRLSKLLTGTAPGVEGETVIPLNSNSRESINHLIKSIVASNSDQHDPFYVLDLGAVADLYHTWTKNLPSIPPFYAVKCNPDPALIGTLAALGANFDCASRAEIESVLALGVAPDRIIYANPCKAEPHIGYARITNVNLTTFDSSSELYKMKMHHPNSSLLLRIKPPVSVGVRQSFETKYGAFDDEVQPLLVTARSLGLSVVGISFHIGTLATVFETYDAAVGAARAVFDLANDMGLPRMSVLDIGGGFAAGPMFEKAAEAMKSSINSHFGDWAGLRVMAEPGRYFAQTVFTLATCVIGKRMRGEKMEYWINDGIFGSMLDFYLENLKVPMVPLERRPEGSETYVSTVFGPTLDPFDVVARELQLPELEVGEWMVSCDMGAYTKTLGSSFNGFSTTDMRVYLAKSVNSE